MNCIRLIYINYLNMYKLMLLPDIDIHLIFIHKLYTSIHRSKHKISHLIHYHYTILRMTHKNHKTKQYISLHFSIMHIFNNYIIMSCNLIVSSYLIQYIFNCSQNNLVGCYNSIDLNRCIIFFYIKYLVNT